MIEGVRRVYIEELKVETLDASGVEEAAEVSCSLPRWSEARSLREAL